MKFRYMGTTDKEDTILFGKIYKILQFERKNRHLLVYLIDENNNLLTLGYINTDKFNKDWRYFND